MELRRANAITEIAKLANEMSNLERQKFDLRKDLSDAKDALRTIHTEIALLYEISRLEAVEHRTTAKHDEEEVAFNITLARIFTQSKQPNSKVKHLKWERRYERQVHTSWRKRGSSESVSLLQSRLN